MDELQIVEMVERLKDTIGRTLTQHAKRLDDAENGLLGALTVIGILIRINPSPQALDAELRQLRLSVHATEAGGVGSEVLATNQAALRILELAMGRAPQDEPPAGPGAND
jgi:hypothetical protein